MKKRGIARRAPKGEPALVRKDSEKIPHRRTRRTGIAGAGIAAFLASASVLAGAAAREPAPFPAESFDRVSWRSVGPQFFGGRIDAIAVPPAPSSQRPGSVMYVGGAGGLFGTTNGGRTWEPLLDRESAAPVQSIAVSPSDPCVVWVGTGNIFELNHVMPRGDGVYKSVDGGATWEHAGLENSFVVTRIVVDPDDANTVYAAALGPGGRASREHGVYKTVDGGRTWAQVLFIDEWTGAVDVALDSFDPKIVYAATWQQMGVPERFVDSGPGSGIYTSRDGGATWKRSTAGLPEGEFGRIGLAASPAPGVVYALAAVPGPHMESDYWNGPVTILRSDDFGVTWRPGATREATRFYVFGIAADPVKPDRVFALAGGLEVSEDGGQTLRDYPTSFTPQGELTGIGDLHALALDPQHSNHLVLGCDVGVFETEDGGRFWRHHQNLSIGQFRAVAVDRQRPFYFLYGESNDHAGVVGPSQSRDATGVPNSEWRWLPSSEAGPMTADPSDSRFVYAAGFQEAEGIVRIQMPAREGVTLFPEGSGWRLQRFNGSHQRSAPIALSPFDSRTVYTGATRLVRSRDRGDHWEPISGRLTGPVPQTVSIMGRDRVNYDWGHNMLSAIAESPHPRGRGVIYVGTYDGWLHVTRDGGKHWSRIDSGLGGPANGMITRVAASHASPGLVYVTKHGGLAGDDASYVFRSRDFGRHWERIDAGLPPHAAAWAIVEHPRAPALLFLGTDVGVFFSTDGGEQWIPLRGNLPAVQVRDVTLQPDANDLVIATYGRGLWILDDVTPFERIASAGAAPHRDGVPILFPIRDAFQVNRTPAGVWSFSYPSERTANAPAVIAWYWFPESAPRAAWRIEIDDPNGHPVAVLPVDPGAGLHRAVWDMRISFGSANPYSTWAALPGVYRARIRPEAGISVRPGEPVAFRIRPDPGGPADPVALARLTAARRRTETLKGELRSILDRAGELMSSLDRFGDAGDSSPGACVSNLRSVRERLSTILAADAPLVFFQPAGAPKPQSTGFVLTVLEESLADLATADPGPGLERLLRDAAREVEAHRRAIDAAEGEMRALPCGNARSPGREPSISSRVD